MHKIICSIPEYLARPDSSKPKNVFELLEEIKRPIGLWSVKQIEKQSGKIEHEQFLENNFTDNGVGCMFRALAGASPYTATPGNILAIDASLGYTSLSTQINSGGTVTSITVGTLIGPSIPSGIQLLINPTGGSASLTVTLTQSITASGTYTVTSVTGPTSNIPVSSPIRYAYGNVPTADPSSLSSPVSYTASMGSSQFTYPSQTGYGNRTLHITNNTAYLFSTTNSPAASAGTYTCAWLCNTSPISANNQTYLRVPFDASLVISSSYNGQVDTYSKL